MENKALNADKTIVFLKILTRSSAWALFAGIIILVISGWGITQTGVIYDITGGLIDRRVADAIHRAANVPVVFFFLAHVFINISLGALRKSRARFWLTNAVLIIIGIALMAITIYMTYIRAGG
jgi:hypothetical protein